MRFHRKFIHSCFFVLSYIFLLCSCGSEEPEMSAVGNVGGEHTVVMHFDGSLENFDGETIGGGKATRATSTTWANGATLYLHSPSGSSTTNYGYATYNSSTKIWTVTYSGTLTKDIATQCYVYYFENPSQTNSTSVSLSAQSAVYADMQATYFYDGSSVFLHATLKPQTSRLRLKGGAQGSVTIQGLKTYSSYTRSPGTLLTNTNDKTFKITTSGYSPYIYCTLADEQLRQLTVKASSTAGYRRSFSTNAFKVGSTGVLTVPTAASHAGWTLVNLNSGKEITVPSISLPTVSNIQSTGATLKATVTSTNNGTITDAGFLVNYPLTGVHRINCGTATSLSTTLTDLSPETTYTVRAFATNEAGTAYSQEIEFTTAKGGDDVNIDREDWDEDEDWNEVTSLCPDDNHPHAIDLGLGVKFACCNVGADSPTGYGNYYAWGETSAKSQYDWSTYKWCNGTQNSMTKYCTSSSYGTVDNKTTLELSDDAARANWGGIWRMPTYAELNKLQTDCTWTWTTVNNINGYSVTGSNGNSIFLPAAGHRNGTSLGGAGSYGYYWSSSLKTGDSYGAYGLYFSSNIPIYRTYRYLGESVRPVTE